MNKTGLSPGGIPPIGLNFTNPAESLRGPSRASEIIAGNLVPAIFASMFFFARVIARGVLTRSWGKDDTFLAVSYLGSFLLTILSCLSTKYGTGHHIYDIPLRPHEYSIPGLKIGLAGLLLYQSITALTKISICFFYLRIFPDKKLKWIIYGTCIFIALYTLPTLLFSIFQCHPVSAHWDVLHPNLCMDPTPAFYASGICNVVTDVWLIAIVVPRIWNLQMGRRQKIALFIIITLSWLVVVAAVVRMVRLGLLFRTRVVDTPWAFYDISIWSGLEVSMGIFCVSAPGTKPVFQHVAPTLLSSISSSLSRSHHSKSSSNTTSESRKRWKYQNGGVFELNDQEPTTYPTTARVRNSGRFWGRDEDFMDDQMFERDSEKGFEIGLPIMGIGQGNVMTQVERRESGQIVKTTTVRISVDEKGRNGSFQEVREGDKSSFESGEDLEGRSYVKM